MALLAESLVEEWLNRAGFFTIRGARFGVSEMDLLAVKQGANVLEARHIEVQISTEFRGQYIQLRGSGDTLLNIQAASLVP